MDVNIIIPCYKLVEHTKLCIESIERNTDSYRIIAIDDGSKDGTREYLEEMDVDLIEHDDRIGWWKSINEGIEYDSADYYVLVDRDCIFTKGWLRKLLDVYNNVDDVGIVTAVSNAGPENYGYQCLHYSDKELIKNELKDTNPHHNDRIYWLLNTRQIDNFGRAVEDKYRNRYDYQTPIFGFFCMISDETIDNVGLFNDKDYTIWHADIEYFWRVYDKGFKTAVKRDTYIHHYKFPPLTNIELEKAPYLKKYGLKTKTSVGQFVDTETNFIANKDWIKWRQSPYSRKKPIIEEGGYI